MPCATVPWRMAHVTMLTFQGAFEAATRPREKQGGHWCTASRTHTQERMGLASREPGAPATPSVQGTNGLLHLKISLQNSTHTTAV